MSKKLFIEFIGSLGNRAGLVDGTVEAGRNSSDCHKNKWDIRFFGITTTGYFNYLEIGLFGNFYCEINKGNSFY